MLKVYPALLKDDHLLWTETAPPNVSNGGMIVYVLVLPEVTPGSQSRGEQMAAALERIAQSGAIAAAIDDPVAWQRALREDRPLYGRNEE